jgi:hypothetical protein
VADDRDGIVFSCLSVSWKEKSPPALDGPSVWSPVAMERTLCFREPSYWDCFAMVTDKSIRSSGEGSI